MAKKAKKKQDNQGHEEQFVELPEDRLGQLDEAESEPGADEKSKSNLLESRTRRQAKGPKDALGKKAEDHNFSSDDLLADVRRSLALEEEIEEPKVGLFARIKNRFQKSSETQDDEINPQAQLEIETGLQENLQDLVVKPNPQKKAPASNKQEEKAIQEFFSDLEALADVVMDEPAPATTDVQDEKVEGLKPKEKAKKPKLPVKSDTKEIDFDAVREVALLEYDETKIEVEERKPDIQEEVRRTVRELRPFERILLIAVGILAVGALLSSGIYLIVDSIVIPTPTPTAEMDLRNIVHPTRLSLPGGWEFNLGEGKVVNGEWTPQGAEWLFGTEISRWVALPWSLQLEAVLRTLKTDDHIELMMSNFDELTFNVYSIQEMTMAELLASDATMPSLLIVLYNDEEADGAFWVVTSLP